MFLPIRIFGLTFGALICGTAAAGDFTMAAVGSFGERLTDCRVDSFRFLNAAPGTRDEYKDSFHSLAAKNLPDGEYEATLQCREARIRSRVTVNEFVQFDVITQNRRIMRSDHSIPQLNIRMRGPLPPGEIWWVTLRAVYDKRTYTGEFQATTGQAHIADPDPGTYLVNVLSTAGYDCLREIDLVEATRSWTFDPAGCTFGVDSFAHLVTDQDRRDRKTTGWYQELRKNDEELFHALDDAAKASADSDVRR